MPERKPSEYPPVPHGVPSGRASDRGWGGGWPHCQSDKIVTIRRRDGLAVACRTEISQLLAILMDETEGRGYDIKPGQTWGYACRSIRGYNSPSNHSWGLAIDINAPSNPMVEGKLITDFPRWLPALWWDYKFFWGGWYSHRKDAMHLEFLGTTKDAKALTERAKRELHGGKDVPYPYYGEKSKRVRRAQRRLKELGFNPGDIDGIYGDDTRRAVRKFELSKKRLENHADGYFGPLTWRLLFKEEEPKEEPVPAAVEAPPQPAPAAPAAPVEATTEEPPTPPPPRAAPDA